MGDSMEPEIMPALGLVVVFIAAMFLFERRERVRLDKVNASVESCRYSVATIAKNLAPKLSKLITEDPDFSSPTLYVVGGDGFPLWTTDNFYPWKSILRKVLKNHGTIHYILTNASGALAAKILRLKSDLESGTEGKIHFYFARSDLADGSVKTLIETFRTFHPHAPRGAKQTCNVD